MFLRLTKRRLNNELDVTCGVEDIEVDRRETVAIEEAVEDDTINIGVVEDAKETEKEDEEAEEEGNKNTEREK